MLGQEIPFHNKALSVATMFALFHKRVGQLAHKLFRGRPDKSVPLRGPIEMAYYRADAAIQKLVDTSLYRENLREKFSESAGEQGLLPSRQHYTFKRVVRGRFNRGNTDRNAPSISGSLLEATDRIGRRHTRALECAQDDRRTSREDRACRGHDLDWAVRTDSRGSDCVHRDSLSANRNYADQMDPRPATHSAERPKGIPWSSSIRTP